MVPLELDGQVFIALYVLCILRELMLDSVGCN
jgi:hypothetical protein